MPVIRFAPDGSGTLSWSAPGVPTGADEASLWAEPNPVVVCDGTGTGVTRIAWRVPKGGLVEVRVGSPAGTLFTRQSGSAGAATTGKWVRDGTNFVLLDAQSRETLATLTVRVTSAGCP